jgi:uncharacterized protein
MKLQPDRIEGVNAIQSCRPGCVTINGVDWQASVLLPWQGQVRPWARAEAPVAAPPSLALDDLSSAHFDELAALQPELVVFGSGSRLRFVSPALLSGLYQARIGIETMDTAAACRTYNVLVAEGRRVLAALLV